jgi:hypothetical protein
MESLSNKLDKLKKCSEVKENTANNGSFQVNAPVYGEHKEVGTKIERMVATKIGTQININHKYVP